MNVLESNLRETIRYISHNSKNRFLGKFIPTKSSFRIIIHNLILLSRYRPWGKAVRPMIIYMIDGSFEHMGLADRIMQIIGVYAWCKHKEYKFGLIANYPFELCDYLRPNYNWKVKPENFSRNIFYSRPLYLGNRTKDKYKSLLTLKKKQLHVYVNIHWNLIFDLGYENKQLFNELFEPIPEIKEFIQQYREKFKSWDCLHFRFINLLGDFNEPQSLKLNDTEKQDLINKCYQFVLEESKNTKNQLLVCSDSVTFLTKISAINGVIVLPGEPAHIDYAPNADFGFYLKTFQDLFMISESESVRGVIAGNMYRSDFPLLAANIKGVNFKRVELK